jgi:Transposase DDE domain
MIGRMGQEALKEKDVVCLGHLKRVFPLLDALKDVGCQRDKAGNRALFFNDYLKLVLLYTWNPLIGSVHDLQQVVALPRVAKALGIKRFSAGSFSESVRIFEPERLKPIIRELAAELPAAALDKRLGEFKQAITLVDGTVVRGLSRLVHSAVGINGRYTTTRSGTAIYGWRLHVQLDLQTCLPHRLKRTGARNGAEQREASVLRADLEAGRCYVCDGGYADYSLFDDIDKAQSSYVIRAAENSVFSVVTERLLSAEALAAGIVRDAIVQLDSPLGHAVRRIEIQVAPHPRRKQSGVRQTDKIILYTNLTELPAELIALIYQHRYTVELFFRILKQLLGMRHLLSQRKQGIDIQIDCALIVCILIQLISGKKPTKAMRNMIGWYLLGLADEQDVMNFLNRPDNTGVKLKAKEELFKKLGF